MATACSLLILPGVTALGLRLLPVIPGIPAPGWGLARWTTALTMGAFSTWLLTLVVGTILRLKGRNPSAWEDAEDCAAALGFFPMLWSALWWGLFLA